jgi:peptide/nickel transport system substrate-binding protein
MGKRTRWARCVALTLMLALVTACGGGVDRSAAPAESTDQLRVALALGDLPSLDPARSYSDSTGPLLGLFGDTLTAIPADDLNGVDPALATEWQASDDLKTYTFTLRPGVKFSTGTEMTSADVVFSFDRLKNIQGPSGYLTANIDTVQAPDPQTVVFTLLTPDSTFPTAVSTPYMSILDSAALKENGGVADESAASSDKTQQFLDSQTVGTGPYVLRSWTRNQELIFDANPDYWAEKPAFQSIVIRDIREASTQAQLLQGGDVDVALNIDPDTAKSLADKGVSIASTQSLNMVYLGINNGAPNVPQLGDPRVRQAIAKAIDYDGINATFADGNARPGAFIPLGLDGSEAVSPVQYDPEGARALLAEAGATGLNFDVTFANVNWYGVPQSALWQKITADLAAVGITINIRPAEYESWVEHYRNGESTLTTGLWAPDFPSSAQYFDILARPEGLLSKRLNTTIPEGEQLYQDYLSEDDPAARSRTAETIAKEFAAQSSVLPVLQPNTIVAHAPWVADFGYSAQYIVGLRTARPAES